MTRRSLAVLVAGLILFGTGAVFVAAQSAPVTTKRPPAVDRAELRKQVAALRTEVEMLRFDYELARDSLLEELKISRQMRMAGGFMSAFSVAFNPSRESDEELSPDEAKRRTEERERKESQSLKEQEENDKQERAAEAAAIAEAKKELQRLYQLLSEKRLDLEDAEHLYRDLPVPATTPTR